jgi:hypothetical protein
MDRAGSVMLPSRVDRAQGAFPPEGYNPRRGHRDDVDDLPE